MFENRSFDNLLGRMSEPGEVASFEGVLGKDLSNPIPEWAPGAERGVVPAQKARSMDAPNPDAGEEHPHTNTQLLAMVAPEKNRLVSCEKMQPPFNASRRRRREPDDGRPRPRLGQHVSGARWAATSSSSRTCTNQDAAGAADHEAEARWAQLFSLP